MSGKFMMNGIEYLGGGSGGSGGNVDDVYVNGVSVLDSDKIAQITSYKEVTLAEYMALPDTKLTDGIMYCIKDVGSANQFPPLIYSDEEREVGVWRDGKPLYQKSISLAGISIATGQYAIVYTQANIELKYANGCFIEDNYVYTVPEPFLRIRQDGNNIVFRAMEPSAWDISGGFLTIRYTKTTDTAGQGIWAGNGAMAHHYSTDEVIVGTWIDGKPLYEKTFAYNISPVNDWTLFDDSVSYDLLIDARGYHKNLIQEVFPLVVSDATNPRWCIQPDHKLYYFITNNITRSGYITLQYTKTTD